MKPTKNHLKKSFNWIERIYWLWKKKGYWWL